MKPPDQDPGTDDGIVSEDVTQLVEHVELTSENPLLDGTDWELAAIAADLEDAPLRLDDGPAELPDERESVIADLDLFAETEIDLSQRLTLVEGEQLELAAALARERTRWQKRAAELDAELAWRNRLLANREAEIGNLSAQLASITLERDGLLADFREQRRHAGQAEPAAAPAAPSADLAIRALRDRLHERGRALLVAREEIDHLRADCEQLIAGLAERGEFIQQLHARLRELEGGQRGGDLRRLLRRFFSGDGQPVSPATEPAAVRAAAPAPEEPAAPPAAAAGIHGEPEAEPRDAAGPTTGLRHYLIGLDLVGRVHELDQTRVSIGRTLDNDLRILDPTVSRLHATLKLNGGKVTVIDAHSRNGVFVNGIQVRFAELRDGDLLTFGHVRFRYRIGAAGGLDN
ncbi:MAG: FHA domain-containing protein [Gammaproteobacteria bacterium]|nr:MAG: FHA domain-containing protein [Gammaproteobacteria bacterium]